MTSEERKYIEDTILNTYGDTVSFQDKLKTLYKFGRNSDIGTSSETVWSTGGDETYVTTNAIDKISSSDAGDTQSVVVEGHTIDSGILTFVVQNVTLAGQTETALPIPLARATRLYNNDTSAFAGTVYVYEDDTVTAGVPQTTSKIHLTVNDGNQSEKASTSISNTDYYAITAFVGYCFDKTPAVVEFDGELRQVASTPKAWRTVFHCTGTNGSPTIVPFEPAFIIPKNSDIRVRAKADGASTDIGCAFNGYLLKVTGT